MGLLNSMVKTKFDGDPRVEIHRERSDISLSKMADDSLDWVYIDGIPNPPFFALDLELSSRKVRRGGVIAGDDYYWKNKEGAPIKSAVDAFVASLGDKCSFELIGQQFLIYLK